MNIIELATDENKDFFGVLKEIVEIYNRRPRCRRVGPLIANTGAVAERWDRRG